ncbi:hypothetical protein [Sulfuriroseicoccus oceanibius]|uniref:Uncharacterized protein n=1 Tax=Sulfuriroseicoccus oceanibius TaxID=2707525 RepID=A0A6B3LFA7_9BACT|nr:hypothetical protein [Sulfuriroseicoccus oceanibius]QQL45107.1 hypothetical protein G3M56_000525 [Sulfuriroseicoccus oceanibius]
MDSAFRSIFVISAVGALVIGGVMVLLGESSQGDLKPSHAGELAKKLHQIENRIAANMADLEYVDRTRVKLEAKVASRQSELETRLNVEKLLLEVEEFKDLLAAEEEQRIGMLKKYKRQQLKLANKVVGRDYDSYEFPDGSTASNVTVVKARSDAFVLQWDGGLKTVEYSELSPEAQYEIGYTPTIESLYQALVVKKETASKDRKVANSAVTRKSPERNDQASSGVTSRLDREIDELERKLLALKAQRTAKSIELNQVVEIQRRNRSPIVRREDKVKLDSIHSEISVLNRRILSVRGEIAKKRSELTAARLKG